MHRSKSGVLTKTKVPMPPSFLAPSKPSLLASAHSVMLSSLCWCKSFLFHTQTGFLLAVAQGKPQNGVFWGEGRIDPMDPELTPLLPLDGCGFNCYYSSRLALPAPPSSPAGVSRVVVFWIKQMHIPHHKLFLIRLPSLMPVPSFCLPWQESTSWLLLEQWWCLWVSWAAMVPFRSHSAFLEP